MKTHPRKKLEIVFLPYRAAMFDAFETIYLAAKADPDCNVYIIPVPYQEINPDGTPGVIHYDGNLFPAGIPITNWQEYDIETRRPDIIFTHCPYDNCGTNFTIHPLFYSKRLRGLCKALVHVPYYVKTGDISGYELFVGLPGVMYATHVILQSEEVRQFYIDYYQNLDKEYTLSGYLGDPHKKILALGSPKFDKVINSKRENYKLPEAWKNLVKKSDGTRKKIVLFIIHWKTWLDGGERYFEKIRSIFDVFRNREDVILWWRPHPNTEMNFRTFQPQWLDDYYKIVTEYKQGGWGIYDDTPDMHRAMCLSDMLYCDGGSIIPLYQCQKKPVVLWGVDANYKTPDFNLAVSCVYDTGDALWATLNRHNALCKLNKKTWKIEYVDSFPQEAYTGTNYIDMVSAGDCLYFPPFSASEIAVYNRSNKKFLKIKIPAPNKHEGLLTEYNTHAKFAKAFAVSGRIFFIPYTFPGILVLDTANNRITLIDDWVWQLNKIICDKSFAYFLSGIRRKNKLVLACMNANAIVEVDIETYETSVIPLNESNNGYGDIVIVEGVYWLLSFHKPSITRWEPAGNTYEEYDVPRNDSMPIDGIRCFYRLVHKGDALFLLPYHSEKMMKFDLNSKTFSTVDNFNPKKPSDDEKEWFAKINFIYTSFNAQDIVYMNAGKTNHFIEYNPETGDMREEKLQMDTADLKKLQKNLCLIKLEYEEKKFEKANECVLYDDYSMTVLENMLDIITKPVLPEWLDDRISKQVALIHGENKNTDGTAGEEILKLCKNF